jgi:predicted transcriptional regulator
MAEYIDTKKLLDEVGLTHDEAEKMWNELIEKNWKVKALNNSGKRWYDLTAPALKSMIKLSEPIN